ncbi:MAG: Lrp/AsnC family transcriptional regulator [Deltaproteobacteria bacterium]|nr:Lrp/AsnC family transcriptional regulator [Deltaproteobacteria bacterium]
MDDTDYRLLSLLRTNARAPISELARKLHLARATIRSRIDRLVDSGVIQGFTIVTQDGSHRDAVRAIMTVKVLGQGADLVIERLRGFPEVTTLHSTNGRWDIVAELEVDTLVAFDRCLRRIRLVQGIETTETSILLASQRKG